MNFNELWKISYFHGMIDRHDAANLLKNNGEFLLRYKLKDETNVLIITSIQNNQEKHFQILYKNGKYFLDLNKQGFTKITELIENQIQISKLNKSESEIILTTPIKREDWELAHHDLELRKELGRGAFGVVRLGTLNKVSVAVKESFEDSLELFKEGRIMKTLFHENIVNLIGITLDKYPILLVTEYCPKGSLDEYLKKNPNLNNHTKFQFILEAANGLNYLHENNVLHCDLASRNCLLCGDLKIKISDFGTSRLLPKNQDFITTTKGEKLAYKYLAPEVILKKILSKKSDVWSFGVLCFEIFEVKQPYDDINDQEAITKILSGQYLVFSKKTPKDFVTNIVAHIFIDEKSRLLIHQIMPKLKNLIKKYEEEHKLKETKKVRKK